MFDYRRVAGTSWDIFGLIAWYMLHQQYEIWGYCWDVSEIVFGFYILTHPFTYCDSFGSEVIKIYFEVQSKDSINQYMYIYICMYMFNIYIYIYDNI